MTELKRFCKHCNEHKYLALMCMVKKDQCLDCLNKIQREKRVKYYGYPSQERHPDFFKKR